MTGNEFKTLGAENQKAQDPNLSYNAGLKADEDWMSAVTSALTDLDVRS